MPVPRRVEMIIDTHHHVGELALGVERRGEEAIVTGAADVHRDMLDSFGLRAAAVIPGFQYERTHGIVNTRVINDTIARYRDSDTNRFPVALGVLEPLHALDVCEDELERLVDELRIDGIAWHTRYQGVTVSDRRMHALIERVADRGLPCYIHMFSESGMESPWMLLEVAKAHPEARIVALDGFSSSTHVRYMELIADSVENVMFDTAISFPLMRPIDNFVERFGSERVLFGTDSYAKPLLYNTPAILNELLASPMAQDDLENIMWRNFVRVFPQAALRLGL